MTKQLLRLFSLTASLLSATGFLFAQGIITGSIAGRVTDPSGAPVPNAAVTIVNTQTGVVYNGQTTADGFYGVRFLPYGNYTVAATQKGFQRTVHPNVLVDPASNPTVNLELAIGSVSQSVTVSEAGALVEAQTADRGNVVDTVRLDNFPSQAGNIFGLAFTSAGVSPTSNQKSYTLYDNSNSSSISINGGQEGQISLGVTNQILIDGTDDHPLYNGGTIGLIPSAQSVAEMKVVSSSYSAEYGRTTG
ncbi:MAG: carboxypeptidase-like regulatory domain-containing protein, partial [Bryobacteraceae bacterium]